MEKLHGWKSVEEAASIIGVDSVAIARWAETINPEAYYTRRGVPMESEDSEVAVKGLEIVRIENQQLFINELAVQGWKDSEQTAQKLRSQGWRSTQDVSQELGISEVELFEEIEKLKRKG